MLGGGAGEKVRGEVADVFRPLAQRRHLDGNDFQPPVQVFAEGALAHPLRQIAVGGADHAQVELDRLLAADPLDLVLLERAQDLALQVHRQITDLVEEERPAVGQLELAQLLLVGAGERAALVAEQLALDQVGRNRRQVHRHERTGLAIAAGVDVARQHFLAGAGLAADQHRHRLGRDLVAHLHHAAHPARAPQHHRARDDGPLDVAEPLQLAARAQLHERLAHARDQLRRREVLGDVVERAGMHRFHRDGDVLDHREHDHADVGMALAHDPQRLEAAHARHLHVEQHQIERRRAHPLQAFLARGGHRRLHSAAIEDEVDVLANGRIVVDDEDGGDLRHCYDCSTRRLAVSMTRVSRRTAMTPIQRMVSTRGVLKRRRKWKLAVPPAT